MGTPLPWQDLNELARVVVDGIREQRFIFMIDCESMGDTLRERAAYLEKGQLPPHPKTPVRLITDRRNAS